MLAVVTTLWRTLLILGVGIATLFAGFKIGSEPRDAYAEIFRNLSEPFRLHYRYVPEGTATGWRLSHVNGNAIPYRVQRHLGSVPEFFDFLQAPHVHSGSVAGPGRDGASLPREVVFRYEWEAWGALGIVDHGSQQPREAAATPPAVGRSPSGGLLATVAFSDPGEAVTALTFWLDEAVDVASLLPRGNADAPGRDVDDVPRYPGVRRFYTIEEQGAASGSLLVVYGGEVSAVNVARFYRSRMMSLGWQDAMAPVRGRHEPGQDALVYRRNGRDCVIGVTTSEESEQVQIVVLARDSMERGEP